jgi:hypothetical protein
MVLVTKYRHPVITGQLKTSLYAKIRQVFMDRGLKCETIHKRSG